MDHWRVGSIAKRFLQTAAALAATLVLVGPVYAQTGRASYSIEGKLIDPSNSAVPGARVMLRGPAADQVCESSIDGGFRFDSLAPGRYRLQTEVPGLVSVDREVEVRNRAMTRVVIRLALAPIKGEISVSGNSKALTSDIANNRNAISVEQGLLGALPILNLDFLSALSRFLDPSNPDSAVSLVVDGMEARNIGVTASAIQEIKINQNPYTAEYPRWSRRRVEVITKSATDRYHGTFNFLFRDHHLNARDAFAVERPPEQRRIFEGSLFGPIGSGKKTSFLLSGLRESEDLQAVVFAQGPNGLIAENTPTPQQNTFFSARLSHEPNDRHAMFWQVNFQDRWQNNLGVGGTVLPEAGAQSRFREDEFIFNYRATISPHLLSQFRILLGRYWAPTKSNLDQPKVVVIDAFTTGGAQADGLRTELHTSITWLLTQTVGHHILKYGVNVPDWSRRGWSDRSNRLGTYFFGSLEDYRLGHPFSGVLQAGDARTVFIEKNLGAFVQDEWKVKANLSLALGLRYDWQNYFGGLNNVSPRLAFAFSPTQRRNFVIRGGAGMFYDRSGPAPIFDILRYDGLHLRRYVISDPPFPLPEPSDGVSTPPASITRLGVGTELPEVFQFNLGVERQLSEKTVLAINYVGTRGRHQFRSRDGNAPLPPEFASRPDPSVSVLRFIESTSHLQGNALDVTITGALGPKITGLAQYTFGKTLSDTGGLSWFPADSFNPRGEWGRADTDRRQQFNLLATGKFHPWLNLGASVSLLSGVPFNITTGLDENRDGLANDRPVGVTRNTGKGPGVAVIDLRWFREWRLKPSIKGKSPVATISLDAFNLFNRVNYQNYVGALSSPFFGQSTGSQPARRIQLGLRLQF
ncbi:MAG: TonB-dependent receptor [Acidobacteriia bacterium]|nr:TonB-dependent receptor [Terriglobia bacterium]